MASIPVAYLTEPDIARLFWLSLVVVNPAVRPLAARIRGSGNES
jgi:hypothetical protein